VFDENLKSRVEKSRYIPKRNKPPGSRENEVAREDYTQIAII
jgi:hypothetical protein